MNRCLKAVILEPSDGDSRDQNIDLRGLMGLFPDDALSGNDAAIAARPICSSIAREMIETDVDEPKAAFRDRGAIRRFFESERVADGDLVLIERVDDRIYQLSKASKRGFRSYL